MKYCHFTNIDNLSDILSEGTLKAGSEGVFVCKNRQDLLPFIALYMQVGIKFKSIDEVVGIEFETDAKFEESFDHNSNLMGDVKAFVSYEDVHFTNFQVFSFK